MKYVTPKYGMAVIETEGILTAPSNQPFKYEVEQKGDGSRNVIMNVFDLFR